MASFGGSNSIGTISVTNGSTTVTGAGVNWSDVVSKDMLFAGGSIGLIGSVNTGTGVITLSKPWAGTTLAGAPYIILFSSPDRYDPTLNATRLNDLLDTVAAATTFDLISNHGSDVASASTVNLQAAGVGNILDITGTTSISAVTLAAGDFRMVRFAGILTLVNSVNLILPGGEDITTVAGDFAVFIGYSAGVVRCAIYQRAKGRLTPALIMPLKTVNYTVLDSDHDARLIVGNNSRKVFTVQAASNYRTGFRCEIINSDSWGSGRGNYVVSATSEFTPRWLYPGDRITIEKVAGFMMTGNFFRSRLPGGTTTLNCHFSAGDDDIGDGLGADSAIKTLQDGLYHAAHFLDFQSFPQSTIKVKLLANESGTGVHYSVHSLVGAQGGAALVIDGNGTSFQSSTGDCLSFYHGPIIQVQNITLLGTLNCGRDSYIYLGPGVNFGGSGPTSTDIIVDRARLQIDGGGSLADGGTGDAYIVSTTNNRQIHILNTGGDIQTTAAMAVNIIANQGMNGGAGYWVYGTKAGDTDLGNLTWTNNNVVGGNKQSIYGQHVLYRKTTGFPGSSDPGAAEGGRIILT